MFIGRVLRWVAPGAVAIASLLGACARGGAPGPAPAGSAAPVLTAESSGVDVVLQAVAAVDDDVVWITGHHGVVLRSTDGGATWVRLRVPDSDSLEFRDVAAFGQDTAYLLAAGPGPRSRIFFTADGGQTWTPQFVNTDPRAFYDCFAFWSTSSGVVVSDAVQGQLLVRVTVDAGAHWNVLPPASVPAALEGEGAFAASGTCVTSLGRRHAWIASEAAQGSRVYRSSDGGLSWSVAGVPFITGDATGVATVAFRDTLTGVALGGRVASATDTTAHAAVTHDGGATWTQAGRPPFPGATYGAVYVPGAAVPVLVAAGPGGLALSRDDGATWTLLSTAGYWAVGFSSVHAGWAAGPGGRITRIALE